MDLQANCGLPLKFDDINENFSYGEEIVFDSIERVPLRTMLPGLLNKSLRYPETVYTQHRNIRRKQDEDMFHNTNLNYDIVMLPSGLMGVEFIRSHIYHKKKTEEGGFQLSEIIEVLAGKLTILLQRNEPKGEDWDMNTKVSEGLVVKLEGGEKFAVPRGYFYTFINTRTKPVVFSRFYMDDCHCDYNEFQQEQGLAYFAIRKNAKQEFVLNPRYREIPEVRQIQSCKEISGMDEVSNNIREDEPLYVQLMNNPGLAML
ncbi:MAG: glucose-6-phosphate isomerase family protein [Candidatus Dojkabacteria bacterium]